MSGFVRRYSFVPGTELIQQIEGAVIVDLPPPGSITGVGTGVVAVVGEFVDMTYAVTVATTGIAETDPRPVEVYSAQDLVDKAGGFDERIGAFGTDMGNGFVEIRSKKFSRLIVCPVDTLTVLATGVQGTIRVWRDLPTNNGAADPTPIVPVSPASVFAGRELRTSGLVPTRLAQAVQFNDDAAYATGTDGTVTNAAAALTNTFDSPLASFITAGVVEGDVLVVGVIGGAGALNTNAGTYRVVSVTDLNTLVVQRLDGALFSWATSAVMPYRLHLGRTANSGDLNQFSEGAGYGVLSRPISATIATGALLTPTDVPDAGTATTWDPLSGLGGAVHPTEALTYDATLMVLNAANTSALDTRYQAAIDALLNDDYPARDINIVVAARKSTLIAAKLKSHVLTAAERGLTRRALYSPGLDTQTTNDAVADTYPGVGSYRSDRIDYVWPGAQVSIPEAVGFSIVTADGKTTTDGILDVTGDTWLASVESNLAPERNPGQSSAPVPAVMAPCLSYARGTPRLVMSDYIAMRARGVAGLRFDKNAGPIFQSGITTSLTTGEKNISRRRMADFIQDSIAQRLNALSKQPNTIALRDSATSEVVAFLEDLKSPGNPSAQRIDDYIVDDVSGNTPARRAANIYVIISKVKLTPTADFIVLQTEIGEGVVITTEA